MEEPPPKPTEDDRRAMIASYEARQRQAETFTWAVPPLALAGQAFLLTIALDPDTRPGAKAVAAAAGLVTLLAALHFLGKHTFNFDWYEAAVDRERIALGWRPLQRNHALEDIEGFPADTLLRQREWWVDEHRTRRLNWLYRSWAWMRNPLVVRLKAVWVWSVALAILTVIDVGLLIDALLDLGDEPQSAWWSRFLGP